MDEEYRPSFDFATTHWSLVAAATGPDNSKALRSLDSLFSEYRGPLLSFLLRQGQSEPDAEDLLQSFFERFLEKDYLRIADRQRGRFRSFLLTALRHFAANEWRRLQAAKRGGGILTRSLHEPNEDGDTTTFHIPVADRESAEVSYDRKWAELLVARAIGALKGDMEAAGKGRQFALLQPYLASEPAPGAYAALAPQLGCAADSVAVSVLRLRRRFVQLFRQEVSRTVGDAAEVDAEVNYLIGLLARQ